MESGECFELIESYYEEYQRKLERFLESDPEMFSLEAEIHHYIEILVCIFALYRVISDYTDFFDKEETA